MTACPRTVASACNTTPDPYACGSRYCPVCGDRWQKDMRVMAVAAADHVPDTVALVTVTAPGDAFFRDDEWRVVGGRPVKERWWNAEARENWALLHREASRGPRQHAQDGGAWWGVMFRAWEYQKRGLLHVHLVLPYETQRQREATDTYVTNLWMWARKHDFGYVMAGDTGTPPSWRKPPRVRPAAGSDAARYVCKYVASQGAGKEGMRDVAQRTAQRGSILYVSRRLTALSGVTMTGLRNRRRIYARYEWARGGGDAWEAARLIEAAQVGRPRFSVGAVARLRMALSRTRAGSVVDATTGEVRPPIPAPPPPQGGRTPLPRPVPAKRAVWVLAPVLLRVPDPVSGRVAETIAVATA